MVCSLLLHVLLSPVRSGKLNSTGSFSRVQFSFPLRGQETAVAGSWLSRTCDGRRRSSQRKTELNDAVEFSWVEISFPLRIGLYIHNWSDYVANLNAFATRLNNEVLNTIKLASCTCSYGGVWTVMVGSGNISAFRSEWTVCWMISWKMDHCRVSCSVACIYTSPRRL